MTKEKSNARFVFPKNSIQPKGFKGIGINGDITVIVKGRVSGVGDPMNEWNDAKELELQIKSCKIIGPETKMSMDKAIKSTNMKV